MENNHRYLAQKIWEIANAPSEQQWEWMCSGVEEIELAPNIKLMINQKGWAWYLWWFDDKHQFREFVKVLPGSLSWPITKKQIAKMLKAQPWIHW